MTLLADPTTSLDRPAVDGAPGPAVALREVAKEFRTGRTVVRALDGITLDVRPGEFVCLVGASGCGKSTLLNLMAGLDAPSQGTVTVDGRTVFLWTVPPRKA